MCIILFSVVLLFVSGFFYLQHVSIVVFVLDVVLVFLNLFQTFPNEDSDCSTSLSSEAFSFTTEC